MTRKGSRCRFTTWAPSGHRTRVVKLHVAPLPLVSRRIAEWPLLFMPRVSPGPRGQVSFLALVFLLLGSWTGLSLPPDLCTGLENSRIQYPSPAPLTSVMYTCPSSIAPSKPFLTCRPGPCAPHMLLGHRAVLC